MSIKRHLTLQAGTVLAGNCGQAQRPLKHKTCVVSLRLNLKWVAGTCGGGEVSPEEGERKTPSVRTHLDSLIRS